MSNTPFVVDVLKNNNAWVDYRKDYKGGYGWRGDIVDLKNVIVHHTGSAKTGNAKQDIDTLFNYHTGHNGWGGIGYHIVVTSEIVGGFAKVAYVGDLQSARAHAPNEKGKNGIPANQGNFYFIGVSIVCNNLNGSKASPEQLRSTYFILEELCIRDERFSNKLKGFDSVKGHGYFDYTWCPDGNQGTIIIPQILSFKPNYMDNDDQDTKDAKAWEDSVLEKYNIDLMKTVDETTPLNREQLLVILHRYTTYLSKTSYDDMPIDELVDAVKAELSLTTTFSKEDINAIAKQVKDSLTHNDIAMKLDPAKLAVAIQKYLTPGITAEEVAEKVKLEIIKDLSD